MLAFERFERCITSVTLGRVTCNGCVILTLLSDELYDIVVRIFHGIFSPDGTRLMEQLFVWGGGQMF